MSKGIVNVILTKLLGANTLTRKIIGQEYRRGHPLRATAMMIFVAPFQNAIYLDDFIKENTFFASVKYYAELQDLLRLAGVDGFELVRIGAAHDGGYVMLNDFHSGGLAYSFGISNEISWDKDMASRGYDVFMYDHTIEKLPEEYSQFHFFMQGISDGNIQDERLKTLEYFIAKNHHEHEKNMILKMDVEGAEWGFLQNVSSEILKQFSQMTFEFHNMINPEKPEQVLEVLQKINRTHQLIHIHANNFGNYILIGGKKFACTIEVSYVLREKYNFHENYDVNLPLKIDSPNSCETPEIKLGRWNERARIDSVITAAVKAI